MRITTKVRQPMKAPSHPGEILQAMYPEPQNVTIIRAAEALGVSRKHVSAIVNGSASVTSGMAARLAAVFGPDVQFWFNLQAQYDVSDVSSFVFDCDRPDDRQGNTDNPFPNSACELIRCGQISFSSYRGWANVKTDWNGRRFCPS